MLRTFYDFHREAGSGPMINPFPLDRARRGGRSHAHHNPVDPWPRERGGRHRSTVAQRPPRAILDEMFELLFAALPSHRDRALVALWISTGARASELLGARQGDVRGPFGPGLASANMLSLPVRSSVAIWWTLAVE